jgi:hypothetical protein
LINIVIRHHLEHRLNVRVRLMRLANLIVHWRCPNRNQGPQPFALLWRAARGFQACANECQPFLVAIRPGLEQLRHAFNIFVASENTHPLPQLGILLS